MARRAAVAGGRLEAGACGIALAALVSFAGACGERGVSPAESATVDGVEPSPAGSATDEAVSAVVGGATELEDVTAAGTLQTGDARSSGAVGDAPTGAAGEGADPAQSSILFGDVFHVCRDEIGACDGEGDIVFRALVIERGPARRPRGRVIGRALVHEGVWSFVPIGEEPIPHPVVTVVVPGGFCEARVTRARHLFASIPERELPGRHRASSFLALEFEGCESGAFGIAGAASVREIPIDHAQLRPAPPALARLVAPHDATCDHDPQNDDGTVRALRLPRHEFALVSAGCRWIVHRGRVMNDRYWGDIARLFEADGRLLFEMSSPSEGWMSGLEHFRPAESPDALPDDEP